jgi:predicted RND superfamily exporter protein
MIPHKAPLTPCSFGGYQGYKRYAIGVAAPMVAWSTILMPIEGALITQFFGFVALYYVDTRATIMGWTPSWYRTYRFILTFIVGASIVMTLIGRGELPDHIPGSVDRAKVFKEGSEEALARTRRLGHRRRRTQLALILVMAR